MMAQQQGPPPATPSDSARAAVADTVDTPTPSPTDSLRRAAADSLQPPPSDSLQRGQDSSPPGSPLSGDGGASGASDDAVTFSARDSLVITFDSLDGDRGRLYGNSEMNYQEATIQARVIEMNFETNELDATGAPSDSAASRPVFKRGDGGPGFTGDVLSYNLDTKRGRVVAARTEQQEGFIEGSAVKVFEDSTLYVRDGEYTTCDCEPDETPSYSLRSNQMKVQDKWVYTGPIQLFLFNVPTPLWLPFGFLPNTSGRRSGPLPPEYGQDNQRGLYLRNWGWYFAMNDYTDLQIRAGVWSSGSWEVRPLFRYRKRYVYNGSVELTVQRRKIGERTDPNFSNTYQGVLRWVHQQEISPTSSANADVDLVTSSDVARRNSDNYNDAVRQEISSSIKYNKNWPGGGRNLSLSASQRQKLESGAANLDLPTLNFSQQRFKPFARETAVGDERWYEKITTQYTLDVSNQYDFNPRDPDDLRSRGDSTLADSVERADIQWYEALVDRRKYQLATGEDEPFDLQASHSVPLSASFRINRFNLSFGPSINTSSDWFISSTRTFIRRDTVEVNDDSIRVDEERVQESRPGFITRNEVSTSLSASTELYGTFPIGVGSFQGVRHRVQPSVSFSYRPNFNDPFWGQTRALTFENGDPVRDERTGELLRYNVFTGSEVRGSNESRSVSMNLGNEFETKRVRVDSTGEEDSDTIKLLDVDLSSSYNFKADSLKLSDIDLDARTDLFNKFSVSMDMTFSPYEFARRFDQDGQPTDNFVVVDRYLATNTPWKPVRLTRFRLSLSGDFQGEPNGDRQPVSQPRARFSDAQNAGRLGPDRGASLAALEDPYAAYPNTPIGYADFSIPWSLSFNFNYNIRKPTNEVTSRSATVSTTFDFNVTPKWKVQTRSGYDFVQGELATTEINLFRDLGCWEMSFRWIPFGDYQSYGFDLHVKSGKLAQLLQLQVPSRGGDSRFGGVGQNLRGTVQGAARGGGGSPFR